MSNLTSRIISGNGRKQVSVYRRLYKQVKLCKLILKEAKPFANPRGALGRSFVLLNPLILSSRLYFCPEAVNYLAVEILKFFRQKAPFSKQVLIFGHLRQKALLLSQLFFMKLKSCLHDRLLSPLFA